MREAFALSSLVQRAGSTGALDRSSAFRPTSFHSIRLLLWIFHRPRSVSARASYPEQIEEHRNCLFLAEEMMRLLLSFEADTFPAARQARCSEERRLDRQSIEACHVFRRIHSFEIKSIGLSQHGQKHRRFGPRRPTTVLNRNACFDSFCDLSLRKDWPWERPVRASRPLADRALLTPLRRSPSRRRRLCLR
jgi:hypothetical protein